MQWVITGPAASVAMGSIVVAIKVTASDGDD